MDNTADLRLLLASRYPLIVAEMREEARFLTILGGAARTMNLPVWVWSAARGLTCTGGDPQYGTTDPKKALDFIVDYAQPAVFVFVDALNTLEDVVTLRRVKEFAQSHNGGQTLVFTAAQVRVPPELDGLAVLWKLAPPSAEELERLVRRMVDDLAARNFPVRLDAGSIVRLAHALRGLPLTEAERLVREAAMNDGALTGEDVAFVRSRKATLLESDGVLELIAADHGTLDAVGGLDRLKEWLRVRGRAFEPAARKFGLEPPRGVLVTGIPGCGKSFVAKTLARTWNLPLVLLDVSRLYGPYVGESEGRLHDALDTADAMAPAVLWIDEIEKGFAAGGQSDGGVSQRILGAFLRWMQERPAGMFMIATSNDVTSLPPELLRKGRFDEVFFVDLPDAGAREAILALQLQKRERNPAGFDLAGLAGKTEGFSGAEIEAAVVGAMYRAYANNAEVTTKDLAAEIAATVPLSRTRAEDITRLRRWAVTHAVPAQGSEPAAAAAG
jgi:AAA+ superfamily predicted ATPase